METKKLIFVIYLNMFISIINYYSAFFHGKIVLLMDSFLHNNLLLFIFTTKEKKS